MAEASVTVASRLRRADRRIQLLDVAGDLALDRGPGAVTIERVAAAAGVSRALAYQHFENAEAVLVAVYQREVATLAERIVDAVGRADDPRAKLQVAISTFLDVVAERHGLFTVLAAAGSKIPAHADDGTRAGQRFTAELLQRIFGLPKGRALLVGTLTFGALVEGVLAVNAGELRRRDVEVACFDLTWRLAMGDG